MMSGMRTIQLCHSILSKRVQVRIFTRRILLEYVGIIIKLEVLYDIVRYITDGYP